ncbi:YfcC family protein [Granulicatella seriolae]|uniref:YfcC family protein n=1 Tax=Granulicatella seriolae TaxID=2967226 RepID=A0ABT1WLZ1_9LACT|nr:YfcC family protein [Granulicatella seriolae]
MAEKVKKQFKMPSSFTVLFIIIALMALLTWFIPAGQYETNEAGNLIAGTYSQVDPNPQGLYEIFMAPVRGMLGTKLTSGAIEVSFFIIMVGGFLGVVTETGALDVGIASVIKNNKGREKRLIPILMLLFALGGTTYGMGEETMAFYPLLIPVMIGVGFDTITAVSIILIGSQIGCLASTVNPFATGVASQAAGISIGDGILWRVIFFIVMYAISVVFVYRYASKIEKDPTKSYSYHTRDADLSHFHVEKTTDSLSGRQKTVLWLFALTFIIMVISLIPWTDLNPNFTFFESLNAFVAGIPFIGQLIGHPEVLGMWYFQEITMLFIIMAIVIGMLYRMKEERFIQVFISGAGELLGVALICAVARGIQVVMNDGMITATILHWGEQGLSNLSSQVFIVLTYLFYLPMSFLIPSTSGLAGATMGIMAPLGEFAKVPAHLIITAFQAASGILNLITPTSGIVMGALALGRIELTVWWKYIAKLIAVVFVASIAILVLATFFV